MSVTESKEADASTLQTILPPEKPATIWTRRLIIAAFWAVVVFLGLPHWTWTTSIYRSSLPLESMNAWADGTVSESDVRREALLTQCKRRADCITL